MRRQGEKQVYIAGTLNVSERAVRYTCERAGLTATWGGSPYKWPKGSLRYTGENAREWSPTHPTRPPSTTMAFTPPKASSSWCSFSSSFGPHSGWCCAISLTHACGFGSTLRCSRSHLL
jgi:hypothetical protein